MNNINSNELKDMPMPDDFNDEDKLKFKTLYNQSKILHADVYEKERWILYFAIILHIRSEKGSPELSNEELEMLASQYKNIQKEVVCKGDEIPYLYDTSNNPMFKDNSYFFENNPDGNVAITSNIMDKVIIELEDKIISTSNIEVNDHT